MPKNNAKLQQLVMKLISIGLSHDISYLEEVKYLTDNEQIMTNQGEISRQEEFTLVHHRMYLSLVSLATLIPVYNLKRLCFHVASVCEPASNNCEKILQILPECDYNDYDTSGMDPVLLNIRYQLETFHYNLKHSLKLSTTFKTVSNECYNHLDYFNRRVHLSESLLPLEYPGVEKYIRKQQQTEDAEHVSQVSDLEKCMKESNEFNLTLSDRFKQLQKLFIKKSQLEAPTEKEVFESIKQIICKSPNVYVTTTNEVYTDLVSIGFQDILSNDLKYWKDFSKTRQEQNLANLQFDWKNDDECGNLNDGVKVDVDEMYKSGHVKVMKLFRKGYCTIDIENILLFTIMEKKLKFLSEEFAYLNKNRNVDEGIVDKSQQNQIQAGFLYILNRHHPEYCRLRRLTFTMKKYYHVFEYYLDTYSFDGTAGKYKFLSKHKVYKTKVVASIENADISEDVKPSPKELLLTPKPNKIVYTAALVNDKFKSILTRPKKMTTIMLAPSAETTFFVSDEIRRAFLHLETELMRICEKKVKINIEKIVDSTSPHMIHATSIGKSTLSVNLQKIRNTNVDPREVPIDIDFPINVSGKLLIIKEYRDEVEYDENFDNPKVKSTSTLRLAGTVVLEKLSHNVKFELDCTIDSLKSKFKCVFQGSKSKVRKKPTISLKPAQSEQPKSDRQNPPPPPPIKIKEEVIEEIVTNHSMENGASPPSYSSVPSSTNSYSDTSSQQQQLYLPPFGSIAPSTSQFIQYSPPPEVLSNGTCNGIMELPTIQINPDNLVVSQPEVKTPPLLEPKIEIIKIENVSPPAPPKVVKNNIQVSCKKMSFAAIPQILETPKLIDFEEDLESMIKPSVISNKMTAMSMKEKFSQAFRETPTNAVPVIQFMPEPIKIKEEVTTVIKAQESLPNSPPPLLHYAKPNNTHNSELRMPTKAEQKYLPPSDSVIVKNGSHLKLETIDLTDDIDQIDLTNDSSIRHEMARKKKSNCDFTFVSCSDDPLTLDAMPTSRKNVEKEFINGTTNRMSNIANTSKLKRTIPPDQNMRNLKVRVVDVMENLKHVASLKKNSTIRLVPVVINSYPRVKFY